MKKSNVLNLTMAFFTIMILGFILTAGNAYAVSVMIGNKDGFGYTNLSSYVGAYGGPVDRGGETGILDSGDVLPDVNRDGYMQLDPRYIPGDVFDNRTPAEKSLTNGGQWTDVTLSAYYNDIKAADPSYDAPGPVYNASFTFTFVVPSSTDLYFEKDHYINLVYGDYDVVPMTAVVENQTIPLLGNSDGGGLDGYIWRAYAVVPWADMLDGEVTIDIVAPNEPFVAFDYALLDHDPIPVPVVPVPAPLLLLGSGLLGLVGLRKRLK